MNCLHFKFIDTKKIHTQTFTLNFTLIHEFKKWGFFIINPIFNEMHR